MTTPIGGYAPCSPISTPDRQNLANDPLFAATTCRANTTAEQTILDRHANCIFEFYLIQRMTDGL